MRFGAFEAFSIYIKSLKLFWFDEKFITLFFSKKTVYVIVPIVDVVPVAVVGGVVFIVVNFQY